MNITEKFCTLLTLTLLTSTAFAAAAAETPLKLGNEKSNVHGVVDARAKVDALAFYVPIGTLDPSKSLAGCTFPEDKYSPNDAGKFLTLKVAQGQGQYSVQTPMTGIRGKCEYVLDTLYINYDSGKVYQNLSILSQYKIDYMNRVLAESNLSPMDAPALKDLKNIFCEFSTTETVGLCQTTDGMLPDPNYFMANSGEDYLLDVTDLPAPPQE